MNKKTIIKITTIILIISSIVLLVSSVYNFFKARTDKKLFLLTNQNFELNEFIKNTTLSKRYFFEETNISKFTALLLINSEDCNPCKKNLINFSSFLTKNRNKYDINQIILIKDTNENKALWFSNTLRANVPKLCGYDQIYIPQLEIYGRTVNSRQLILVDNVKKIICARVRIVRNNLLSNEKLEEIFNTITNYD